MLSKPMVLLLLSLHHLQISLSMVNAAAGPACSSGIYKALLALSSYPPAESYCSTHYPLPVVTVTTTSTQYDYTTQYNKRAIMATSTSKTTTTATGQAAKWSSVLSGPKSVISTVCSCIENQSTTTKTVTTTSTITRAPACTNQVLTKPSGCQYNLQCLTGIAESDCSTSSGILAGSFNLYSCIDLCDSSPGCVGIYYVEPKFSCYLYTSNTDYFCQLNSNGYSPFADVAFLVKDTCSKKVDHAAPS